MRIYCYIDPAAAVLAVLNALTLILLPSLNGARASLTWAHA